MSKKVLVACERSGRLKSALWDHGVNAWSCDLEPSLRPEKHIIGDACNVAARGWDAMIAFPPCTYLTKAGVFWIYKQPGRWQLVWSAAGFFRRLLGSEIPVICLENPVPHRHAPIPKYSQIIQPYQFGENKSKKTCLWLKGLPHLLPTEIGIADTSWYDKRDGRPRSVTRSETPIKVAEAMAAQWSKYLR